MALSKTTLALLVVAALTAQSSARPTYVAKIPNGANVKGVAALGHVDPEGGGARNKFGLAFAAAGMEWTAELCKADSDGDGQTNGQELGDPCCQWTEAGGKVEWSTGVSAPGDAASKSDPKLWADVKCAGGASNSTSGSAAANSTAGGSAGGAASKAPATSTSPSASSTPSSSSKAPAATTAAPKSAAVGVSTGAAVMALAAATTAAALL